MEKHSICLFFAPSSCLNQSKFPYSTEFKAIKTLLQKNVVLTLKRLGVSILSTLRFFKNGFRKELVKP